ncbi:hypothetical protein P4S68_04270 [Pseudoalteromonas sp. Hal099]
MQRNRGTLAFQLIPLPINQSWFDEKWLYKLFQQPLTTKDKYLFSTA